MFERFAKNTRVAVVLATEEAREASARAITPSYLLLGVAAAADGRLARTLDDAGLDAQTVRASVTAETGPRDVLGPDDAEALGTIGIDLDAVRRSVESRFGAGALDNPSPGERRSRIGRRRSGHIPFDRGSKKCLELALREAAYRKDTSLELEHLVLGLLREADADLITLVERHEPVEGLRDKIEALLDTAA